MLPTYSRMHLRIASARLVFFSAAIIFVSLAFISIAKAQQPLPDAPSATKGIKAPNARPAESDWPRTFTSGSNTFSIYPPQVDKWEGNQIDFYSAVEAKTGKESAAKYGVVWLQARTEVDKVNRLVTLDRMQVVKVKFPATPEKEAELQNLLSSKLPGVTKTVSLDRLEAAVDNDDETIKGVEVKNEPPKIIIADKPSLLVLIDGMPQMREVAG